MGIITALTYLFPVALLLLAGVAVSLSLSLCSAVYGELESSGGTATPSLLRSSENLRNKDLLVLLMKVTALPGVPILPARPT